MRHAPPGVVGAVNRGLAEARGEIALLLDDDIAIADRDLVLTMGAGSIGAVAHELPTRLGVTSARGGR